MLNLYEMVKNNCLDKEFTDRILELYDMATVEPAPKMVKIKTYSGQVIEMENDKMIYRQPDNKRLAVAWDTPRLKPEFDLGVSFYCPEEKIKVSALFKDRAFVKYYCEVVEVKYIREKDIYIFVDLIVDVNLHKDGRIEVLDIDELEKAVKRSRDKLKKYSKSNVNYPIKRRFTILEKSLKKLITMKNAKLRCLVSKEKSKEILKVKENILRKIDEGQILPERFIEMIEKRR